MEHCWIVIMPFWLSIDDLYTIAGWHRQPLLTIFVDKIQVTWYFMPSFLSMLNLKEHLSVHILRKKRSSSVIIETHTHTKLFIHIARCWGKLCIVWNLTFKVAAMPLKLEIQWRCRGIVVWPLDSSRWEAGFESHCRLVLLSFSKTLYSHCCSRPRC